ncbi:MAG: glycosyltransferase family 4 protein [Deltaproteobacteria bacterium]|nr:glycosyltransferase family 4 protein [Deltaproteobacteria bacterium]
MKIAIIRKKYNPYGGAERYLQLLSEALVHQGHEVHILSNHWVQKADTGIVFHRVSMLQGLSLFKVWSFPLACRRRLRELSGAVVFSNERLFRQDIFRASDGVHRTWLRIRSRHASPLRRLSFALNPLHLSVRFFDWYIYNRRAFAKIIAPSQFIKNDILQNYPRVREEDIQVIYNGVDLERFHPRNKSRYREAVHRELGFPPNTRLLLFVGTGFERKGLMAAVEALRYLPETILLLVVGKGRTTPFRKNAERWGVGGRVLFLGGVTEGVERYYGAADILVAPTLYEPMANVILEAMATGIAVVTSRASGNSEVIDEGRSGWLLDNPRDPAEIARQVQNALDATDSDGLEAHARSQASQYTLERTIQEIMNLLSGYHA